MIIRAFLLLLAGCFCSAGIGNYAFAHEFRPGHMQLIEVNEGSSRYHVIWKEPILLNTSVKLDPVFSAECAMSDVAPPKVGNVALIYHWRTDCDLGQSSIEIGGLPFSHTDVLVSLTTLDGEKANYVLRPDAPSLDLREQAAPVMSYFVIGVEHLVFGIDHVLFVIGLFLFIRDPIALIKTITAFTLSHSITLALSVLELVKLDQGPTEAVIALSIFFLARVVQKSTSAHALLKDVPGSWHLFSDCCTALALPRALADIGLPKDDLWLSLLLFNVGIEAGQVAVILVLAVFAWILSRLGWQTLFNKGAAWSMGCLATYWTLDRTFLLF